MMTVSDKEKYVCIWGTPSHHDCDMIDRYRSSGYTIVRMNNGTGNIKECIQSVLKSSDYT